jgi:phage terminase Nu1 subunit (DNA packaging protein)
MSKSQIGRRFLGEYLTEAQLAAELGRSVRHIKRWRSVGLGPPFTRIGRSAVYRIEAVRAWIESREREMPRGSSHRLSSS